MDLEHAQPERAARPQPTGQIDTRLQGNWLIIAHVAWVAVVVLALGVFIARIPFTFTDYHILCTTAACSTSGRLTSKSVQELHQLGLSVDFYIIVSIGLSIVLECGYVAIGMVIFWRKSDEFIALFTSLALITFGNGFNAFDPVTPLPLALQLLTFWIAFFGSVCNGLFFYLFPTGGFVPRWIGLFAATWMVYWGFHYFVLASFLSHTGLDGIFFFSLLASIVAAQVYRYRRVSTPTQRRQTKWVVYGLSLALVGSILSLILFNFPLGILANMGVGVFFYACLLLIPLSIGIAIMRYRLWDIDAIINRTLVYGALTAGVAGLYILVVGYLGALFRTGGNLLISLLATGLVAVLFQPLRGWLQRSVNRLIYGQRDEPYAVVARLGRRLESTLAPEAVLPTIVETVAQALKLPYAAITWQQDGVVVIAATFGQAQDELLHLPLSYQGELIGELVLAPRGPGESFTPADRALLSDLARQAGVAAHAVRLTTDLQRLTGELQQSRTELVTAREEERRRLRRDLHDGLGSQLSSVTFQLDAACNLLAHDPQAVRTLLIELKGQMQTSIADIRRLVYNLRPPILDEWGLVAALREQVVQYQLNQVQVTVDAPESLPALPAAVEVAAYRIALEALANVIRHAGAGTCAIRLDVTDEVLIVEIQDNGRGLPPHSHAGVGISAMRERAAELGGSCVIEHVATGGTRVNARLPFVKE